MKGQILIRKTGQKDRHDRDMAVLLGLVSLEDISELNNHMSPEDLLSEHIWKIPK